MKGKKDQVFRVRTTHAEIAIIFQTSEKAYLLVTSKKRLGTAKSERGTGGQPGKNGR